MNRPKKDRLGRGLGALLGDYMPDAPEGQVEVVTPDAIVPNPLQPRTEFTEDELRELTDSIRENGLLQPLVVRPSSGREGRFELVAGERRLRAIRDLGWDEVPVLVREVDDEALLVLALVENLQREQLSPLEEAQGYETLANRFNLTQEEIAQAVGKRRSTVANLLRLLGLPASLKRMLASGDLSMGHARALLAVSDPVRAAEIGRMAVKEGWSVRETERFVAETGDKPRSKKRGGRTLDHDPVIRTLEEALQERLATRVRIRASKDGKGTIEVPFHSAEDFERIFGLIAGTEASDLLH